MCTKKQVAFFFGAGAETCFQMPLGAQYTLDTILSKRSEMMEALRFFYSHRTDEYSSSYVAEPLLNNKSHTFVEIVARAAMALENSSNIDSESREVVDLYKKAYPSNSERDAEAEKTFKETAEEIFKHVVVDIDTQPYDSKDRYKCCPSLREKFSYYGTVEKDFSTIINPRKAGPKRFWRLINYFWSAYFSIIIPVLNLSSKYRDVPELQGEGKYLYILNHLSEIVEYIYSDGFKKEIGEKYKESYYFLLKECFPKSEAITTNYTPFLEFAKFTNTAYLAGKLSQFEIPEELSVVKIDGQSNLENKFIFPYLSTQAPLKPIIDCAQLTEYYKFMQILEKAEILVVIGYGINENDNHINAFLHDFATKKKIIIVTDLSPEECRAAEKLKCKNGHVKICTVRYGDNREVVKQIFQKIQEETQAKIPKEHRGELQPA